MALLVSFLSLHPLTLVFLGSLVKGALADCSRCSGYLLCQHDLFPILFYKTIRHVEYSPSSPFLLFSSLRSSFKTVGCLLHTMSSVTQLPHYFAGRSPGPDLAPFESPHSEHASAPISRPCPIAVPQSFQHESRHALEESQDLYNDQISKEKALYHPPVSQTLSQPRTPDAPQALDRRKEICKGSIEKTDTTSRHSFSSPGISRSTSDPEKQCHPRYPVRFDVEYLGSPDLYSTATFMRDELRDEETILKQHATKILVSLTPRYFAFQQLCTPLITSRGFEMHAFKLKPLC